MAKKTIAFYVPSMRGGGAERVTLTLANAIAERGYNVDLLLASAEGPYMESISKAIRVVNFDEKKVLKTLFKLTKYLRHEKPSVLCCAMGHTGIIGSVAKTLAFSKTRIIIGIHNTISMTSQNLSSPKREVLDTLIRLYFPRSFALVPVSQGVADDLLEQFKSTKEKIHTIYNPVVTQQLKHDMNAPVEHPWLTDNSIPVVLAAGRFAPQKEFGTLIRAFEKVLSQQKARLIIIGEGQQRKQLTDLIKELELDDCVDLPGFVDNPYAYMKNADLFVLSSSFEGLPTVLIEAMACGCPVVSTDCPSGPKEILENGAYGKLVPVNDIDALALSIIQALSTTHDTMKIQQRAEYFSEDRIVNEYLSLFLSN